MVIHLHRYKRAETDCRGREAAKKSAERATEAKSRFLSAASHDLRQPLQTLKLLHGLLERSVGEGQSRIFVQRMGETMSSMLGILNTVLDINQIEAGMAEPQMVSFPIGDLLGKLFREFYYPAQAAGLQLRVVRPAWPFAPIPVCSSRSFAIFCPMQSSTRRVARSWLAVAAAVQRFGSTCGTTGIGIPEDRIEDVFQDISATQCTDGAEDGGLGLGLSIVKRLGDLLGLKIAVRSHCIKVPHS